MNDGPAWDTMITLTNPIVLHLAMVHWYLKKL